MSKLHAALLIVAATTAGIYAVATTIATTAATGFATAETNSHTRIVEFSTTLKRVADESSTAHAKCERAAGKERETCNAAVSICNAPGPRLGSRKQTASALPPAPAQMCPPRTKSILCCIAHTVSYPET